MSNSYGDLILKFEKYYSAIVNGENYDSDECKILNEIRKEFKVFNLTLVVIDEKTNEYFFQEEFAGIIIPPGIVNYDDDCKKFWSDAWGKVLNNGSTNGNNASSGSNDVTDMKTFYEKLYEYIAEERVRKKYSVDYSKYYKKIKEKLKDKDYFIYRAKKNRNDYEIKELKIKNKNRCVWKDASIPADKAVFETFNKLQFNRISVVFKPLKIQLEDFTFNFYVFSDFVVNRKNYKRIKKTVKRIVLLKNSIYKILTIKFIPNIAEVFSNVSNRYTAAVSILIRNFAHNIGSHVINNYAVFLRNNRFDYLMFGDDFMRNTNKIVDYVDLFINNTGVFENFIKDFVKNDNLEFISYIKERAILWALIAGSAGSKPNTGIRASIEEMIDSFNSINILKKTVNYTENVKSYRIELEKKEDKKYFCFIPYGRPGIHALFSILENIVRNVKHWKRSGGVEADRGVERGDGKIEEIKIKVVVDENSTGNESSKIILKIYDEGLSRKYEEKGKDLGKLRDELNYYNDIYDFETNRINMNGLNEMRVASSILMNRSLKIPETISLKELYSYIRLIRKNEYAELDNYIKKLFPFNIVKDKESKEVFYKLYIWKYEESKIIDEKFLKNYHSGEEEIARFERIGIKENIFKGINNKNMVNNENKTNNENKINNVNIVNNENKNYKNNETNNKNGDGIEIKNFYKHSDLPLKTFLIKSSNNNGNNNKPFCEISEDGFNNKKMAYEVWIKWYLGENILEKKILFKRGNEKKLYDNNNQNGSDGDISDAYYILTHDREKIDENKTFLPKDVDYYNVETHGEHIYIGFTSTESWVQERNLDDFYFKMIEVLESKVLFIEERIYDSVDNKLKELYKILKINFVRMINNEISYFESIDKPESKNNSFENIISNINSRSNDNSKLQFIIIHTSHLENIVEKVKKPFGFELSGNNKEEKCKNLASKIGKYTKFLIFTSGKEEPLWVKKLKEENEEDNNNERGNNNSKLRIKFIDYSTISNWFFGTSYALDSKWKLIRGLLNL
jgi:hypothetical protein